MSGFIYAATAVLNSLFPTPDQDVMQEMNAKYVDRNQYQIEMTAPDIADTTRFFRMEDDVRHKGVVVEVTYTPEKPGVTDHGLVYLRSAKELMDTLGIRHHMRGLRKKIIEEKLNEDGTYTAKVLNFFGNWKNFHYIFADEKKLRAFADELESTEE